MRLQSIRQMLGSAFFSLSFFLSIFFFIFHLVVAGSTLLVLSLSTESLVDEPAAAAADRLASVSVELLLLLLPFDSVELVLLTCELAFSLEAIP